MRSNSYTESINRVRNNYMNYYWKERNNKQILKKISKGTWNIDLVLIHLEIIWFLCNLKIWKKAYFEIILFIKNKFTDKLTTGYPFLNSYISTTGETNRRKTLTYKRLSEIAREISRRKNVVKPHRINHRQKSFGNKYVRTICRMGGSKILLEKI